MFLLFLRWFSLCGATALCRTFALRTTAACLFRTSSNLKPPSTLGRPIRLWVSTVHLFKVVPFSILSCQGALKTDIPAEVLTLYYVATVLSRTSAFLTIAAHLYLSLTPKVIPDIVHPYFHWTSYFSLWAFSEYPFLHSFLLPCFLAEVLKQLYLFFQPEVLTFLPYDATGLCRTRPFSHQPPIFRYLAFLFQSLTPKVIPDIVHLSFLCTSCSPLTLLLYSIFLANVFRKLYLSPVQIGFGRSNLRFNPVPRALKSFARTIFKKGQRELARPLFGKLIVTAPLCLYGT